MFYDYDAGSFGSSGGVATILNTGEGAGSAAVVASMAGLVDLVNSSADVSAHRGSPFSNDLVLRHCAGHGSHETIALENQWNNYAAAANRSHTFSEGLPSAVPGAAAFRRSPAPMT